MKISKNIKFLLSGIIMILIIQLLFGFEVYAEPLDNATLTIPQIGIDLEPAESPQEVVSSLQILFLLTIISLAPSILIMMTSFTRIIIALHFLRSAWASANSAQSSSYRAALFLTLLLWTYFSVINEQALKPYTAGQISGGSSQQAMNPIKFYVPTVGIVTLIYLWELHKWI